MEGAVSFLVNCSILFTELPVLQRPAAAAAAGFDAVEFWWPFPESAPAQPAVDAFVRAVQDAGVRLVGLNFAAGDMASGDRGLVSWPGREEEFRANVEIAVGIGQRLGTTVFNALYGNRIEGVDPEEQDAVAVHNLTTAARAASRIGAMVVIEPLSAAPDYPLRTATDVLAVIDNAERAAGITNLRLLADLYHLTVNGAHPMTVISQHAPRIGHVQVADAPGRHEPGTGQIPIRECLRSLSAAGYRGWVSLEYFPSTSTERSFDWLASVERSAPHAATGVAAPSGGEAPRPARSGREVGARAPLVLFLPGMLATPALWAEVTARLSTHATPRLSRIDLDDTITGMAETVLAAAPARFALVGHSLGAIVALEIARRAPTRVTQLALLNASALAGSPEQLRVWDALRARLDAGEFGSLVTEQASANVDVDGPGGDSWRRQWEDMALAVGPAGLRRQLRAQTTRPDARPYLRDLEMPTLVISGGSDRICPLPRQEELLWGLPDARHLVLDGVGHMSPLQAPAQIAAALAELLARRPSPS